MKSSVLFCLRDKKEMGEKKIKIKKLMREENKKRRKNLMQINQENEKKKVKLK